MRLNSDADDVGGLLKGWLIYEVFSALHDNRWVIAEISNAEPGKATLIRLTAKAALNHAQPIPGFVCEPVGFLAAGPAARIDIVIRAHGQLRPGQKDAVAPAEENRPGAEPGSAPSGGLDRQQAGHRPGVAPGGFVQPLLDLSVGQARAGVPEPVVSPDPAEPAGTDEGSRPDAPAASTAHPELVPGNGGVIQRSGGGRIPGGSGIREPGELTFASTPG